MTTMTVTVAEQARDIDRVPPPHPELEAAVDAALERWMRAGSARSMSPSPRRTAFEARATTEPEAWACWWRRFEPARERYDLPAIRGMILGLMAGYGLSRLIEGVPERSLTRRVCDVVGVLHRLNGRGEHELVSDLAGLALRRLETDGALAANPHHWAWDAAEDLRDLSAGLGELALGVR
ncbi:hypothetical protein [Embleya hyalina]|uniref:Uncharacterized protein n=1 Tax=Embleya hyalina TaxID=516124 RepID=A0A401YZP5_9ACTN|nr:hypothetical protein [Embleya hyalina]GCE00051.1 hypothetical protein EHYA_07775 [Embleya hyalina]